MGLTYGYVTKNVCIENGLSVKKEEHGSGKKNLLPFGRASNIRHQGLGLSASQRFAVGNSRCRDVRAVRKRGLYKWHIMAVPRKKPLRSLLWRSVEMRIMILWRAKWNKAQNQKTANCARC